MHKFKEIASNYKAIFFDSYGVLRNSDGMIDGINKSFKFLEENGIDYFILTNDASRSISEISENFQRPNKKNYVTEKKIISSGIMAMEFLKQKIPHGKVAYLGTKESTYYINAVGLEAVPLTSVKINEKSLDEIKAIVFLDDEGFDWKQGINNTLNILRRINVPAIIANSDQIYPVNKKNVSAAIGGIADLIEGILGRHFIRFGKPDVQIFNYAFEQVNQGAACIKKSDILMVGDTLTTDIIGGNKFGIDTMLVLSGTTRSKNYQLKIKSLGINPNFISNSILT